MQRSQTPVIALDQSLFALAKQIQWIIVEFSEVNLVLMRGEFHMEMASLKWLSGTGWKEVMCNAGVATQEEAESSLSAYHVTRTRCAHQVTAASLHILMNKAYNEQQAKSRENEQENMFSKEEWKDEMAKKSPQFQNWSSLLTLEVICLRLIRAFQKGDFPTYIDALRVILP